jgi:hypothetical protein
LDAKQITQVINLKLFLYRWAQLRSVGFKNLCRQMTLVMRK